VSNNAGSIAPPLWPHITGGSVFFVARGGRLAVSLHASSAAALDQASYALVAVVTASALEFAVQAAFFASIVLYRSLVDDLSCSSFASFPWWPVPFPFSLLDFGRLRAVKRVFRPAARFLSAGAKCA